ncbi:hypothetical protein HanXRQr2_Chr16g0732721 [Helianthus annuus]|uniref:Uncharacterized protein n=1 Tax=Helianthus annuus TaxID=4232 RepID=A0A9K3DPB5_HELAN|nr:hypothetical protein HanXRQr2_Chr16g0732721 [Helianthus annuus]KAJ0441375.1 hypothetical protein HanIR_Chr16g0797001 [Helianthus annuus]KAJ0820005.1 hypothetical protein HanPSC8_Chr16g0702701 [Helianthus annuus]
MRILKNMLEERKQKPNKVKADFFDHVLEELKQANTILIEEIALDLMFVLLFTSFDLNTEKKNRIVYMYIFNTPTILLVKTPKNSNSLHKT